MLKEKNKRGFLRDSDIKRILSVNEKVSINFFAGIIARLTKVDENKIRKNLRFIPQDVSFNNATVKSEVDHVLENDTKIFNFEFNNLYTRRNMIKNNAYVFQLYLRQISTSDEYDKIKPVTQICINSYDLYHRGDFIYHSVVMESKYLVPRENTDIDFYDINLEFLYEMSYNRIKEGTDLEKMLYFLTCGDKKFLINLYKGDVNMTELEKQRQLVMDNFDSLLYYNRDDILPDEVKIAKEQAMKDGLKEGRREGRREGFKESQIEFVKNLISKDMDIEFICEVSNLSIDEIEKIKEGK